MTAIRIPFGLKDGEIVHISHVPPGLGCGCRCLNCDGALVARKGNERQAHFAHRSGMECVGAVEGALHKVAKDILCKSPQFYVPEYLWVRAKRLPLGETVEHRKQLARGGAMRVSQAIAEYRAPIDFIPDVVLFAESARREPKPLFVEIVVTNPITTLKKRHIRRFGTPVVELRLTLQDLTLPMEALRQKIIGNSSAKRWIFHPGQVSCEKAFVAEFRRRRRDSRRAKPVFASPVPRWIRSARKSQRVGMADFLESELDVQRFYETHHRWPTLDEARGRRRR